MPLVKDENPIDPVLGGPPLSAPKPKRVMSEAQLENLRKAREAKAAKRNQVTLEIKPIETPKTEGEKVLESKVKKSEKIQKKIMSTPVKPPPKKTLTPQVKQQMAQQSKNIEIEQAKKFEFESKVRQEVQKELAKIKREALEKQNKELLKLKLDEEAYDAEPEQDLEEVEPEPEQEPEPEPEPEPEQEPEPEPEPEPTPEPEPEPPKKKVLFQQPPPTMQRKPPHVPVRVNNPVEKIKQVHKRSHPQRRDFGDHFLNRLLNQDDSYW